MLSPADFEDLFPELFAPKAAAKGDAPEAAPAAAEEHPVQTFPMRWFDGAFSVGPLPQRHVRPEGAVRLEDDRRKAVAAAGHAGPARRVDSERELVNG